MTLEEYIKKVIDDNNVVELVKAGHTYEMTFTKGSKLAGVLKALRKLFPDNYVGKEGNTYTIYAGDKEFNEFMHKPLDFLTPQKAQRMFRESLKQLKTE